MGEDEPPAAAHPEADLVESLAPRAVLDAGCGTGRVAIELTRRGIAVVGVDLDPRMLQRARRQAPGLSWRRGDLATVELARRFDVVLLAGNVVIFLAPGSEAAVVRNMARHLRPGGYLVAGFAVSLGYLPPATYEQLAADAGLLLVARYAGWERQPWTETARYIVTLHRRAAAPPPRATAPAPPGQS